MTNLLLSSAFMLSFPFIVLIAFIASKTKMHQSGVSLLSFVLFLLALPLYVTVGYQTILGAILYPLALILSFFAFTTQRNVERQIKTAILDQVNNHHNYEIFGEEHLAHVSNKQANEHVKIIDKLKHDGSIPNTVQYRYERAADT